MKGTTRSHAGVVRPVILPLLCMLSLLALPLLLLSRAEADNANPVIGFNVRSDRPFMQEIPEIPLGDADLELLSAGKPVTRLLDTPGGLKASYMRIFLPVDTPTIWHIISDIEHFSMVAPQYPKNGSLTDKRRTFMPYVFDSAACENGRYLYQLIVMPLIAPRHFTIRRSANRTAFPWERTWSQEPEMRCQDKLNPAMEKYRTEAVITTKNEGSWRLSPLPRQFVKGREDLLKTDCIYYVDSNPGGNLSSFMRIVNKVTEVVLPALADNLLYHAKQWDDHMRKHHTARQYEEWRSQVAAFRSERGYVP